VGLDEATEGGTLRKWRGFRVRGKLLSLSGFYETAVESKAIPVCFSLLGVFAFGLFLLE
jgi:hypothetical protein